MGILSQMKKSATDNRTKIQTDEERQLETILNQLFYLPKNIEEETAFVKQVMTRGLESQERSGLHASAMLVDEKSLCIRQQVLSLHFKMLQGEQTPVNLQRIFEEGNAIHEMWQRLLIRGGYGTAKDMDFTRYYPDYQLSYTPDIICEIPQFFDGKMVGEIKSVNTFQFQKMSKHPSAWKQCQWYMHLLIYEAKANNTWNGKDYTKGFVLSHDKNTQDFKVEVYSYSPKLIAPFIERAESIAFYDERLRTQKKMVRRPSDCDSPESKRCFKCPMRDACWNIGMGRIKL